MTCNDPARWRIGLLLAAVVALAPGCGDPARTYSIDEAKQAFADHGFVLVGQRPPGESVPIEGLYFSRGTEGEFLLVVPTDAEADDGWRDYDRMQDGDTFDARRANVVVISDSGLTAPGRRRVMAALRSLPDRGSDVDIAGSADNAPPDDSIVLDRSIGGVAIGDSRAEVEGHLLGRPRCGLCDIGR